MTPFPRAAYGPLAPYAPDRRPAPVDLSDNTNRWGAHPDALRAVREAAPEALLRYPAVYADRLKAAVAFRFDVPTGAVATGCGSDDLLDSTFRAVCEPGDGVRYLVPTFSMIEPFARMNDLDPLPVAPGASLPDPARLLQHDPGLVYLCRPNNPTGEVLPGDWVRALVEAAGPAGPVILIDEAYADFMTPPETRGGRGAPLPERPRAPEDFLREAARSRRVVVLRTFSKAYGLAGLRVGFAVGAPEVVREIEKSRGPYKVGRLAEEAALAALDDAPGWVPRHLEAVRTERARLARELEARGLAPLPSGANFLCVPVGDVGPGDASGLAAALRERGVAVRPFPRLPGVGEAVRVTIGPRHETDRFLAALDEVRR